MEKRQLREALFQVELLRRRWIQPRFVQLGLTVGQGQPRVLHCLREQGPMTQRELADACFLDTATLSRTLDRLEEAGLVLRQPHGASRRAYQIVLTSQGEQTAGQVDATFQQFESILCQGFSDTERAAILSGIQKVQDNIQRALDEAP